MWNEIVTWFSNKLDKYALVKDFNRRWNKKFTLEEYYRGFKSNLI